MEINKNNNLIRSYYIIRELAYFVPRDLLQDVFDLEKEIKLKLMDKNNKNNNEKTKAVKTEEFYDAVNIGIPRNISISPYSPTGTVNV